eukprot:TRINITY_DN18599_c0_g1_i1.p1 TRINITY_DN18599_c0_g1~~TRINITY_DN18599_c0_g1_i1.p1  ORF type:complete len:963 (-),score=262.94 TRINITY_DN18599_c0_g1_i1:41-2929(-)
MPPPKGPLILVKTGKKGESSKARVRCDCQGTTHVFVNNCIECGRIVCVKEGPGPCFYCGAEVDFEAGREVNANDTMDLPAVSNRPKFPTISTKIWDDAEDYYSNDVWLSPEERLVLKKAEEKKIREREEMKNKFVIDLFGKRVVSEDSAKKEFTQDLYKILQSDPSTQRTGSDFRQTTKSVYVGKVGEKKGPVVTVQSKKVQHEFFPDVEAEDLDINFEDIPQKITDMKAVVPLKTKGIVEGFSGLISMNERMEFIKWCIKHGANYYVYAAKEDASRSSDWRAPDNSVGELSKLQGFCKSNSVIFNYALHPLDISWTEMENEVEAASQKLIKIHLEAAIDHFTIMLNEVSLKINPGSSLAQEQVTFIEAVKQKVNSNSKRPITWYILPTFFHCRFQNGKEYDELKYLKLLNQKLSLDVNFFWTGLAHLSNKITKNYLHRMRFFFGQRKVALWDNTPNNDYRKNVLFLNPYSGRDESIGSFFDIVVLNPMSLLEPSKLQLSSAFKFLADPSKYKASECFKAILTSIVDQQTAAALAQMIFISPGNILKDPFEYPKFIHTNSKSEEEWFTKLKQHLEKAKHAEGLASYHPFIDNFSAYVDMNINYFSFLKDKEKYRKILTDRIRQLDNLLRPTLSSKYMTELHRFLQRISYPPRLEVLRKECDEIHSKLFKFQTSTGVSRVSPETLKAQFSEALRRYDQEIRPLATDDDLKNFREYLNYLFVGASDPKKGPLPTGFLEQINPNSTPADRARKIVVNPIVNKPDKPTLSSRRTEVKQVPGLIIVPNWISSHEETKLLSLIDHQIWSTDLARRTQQYGYLYDYSAVYSDEKGESRVTETKPIPAWLDGLCQRLYEEGFFPWKPDQIIINEYTPGQGINPHVDHVPSFREVIASLSLHGGVMMNFSNLKNSTLKYSHYLTPRCLFVMTKESRYEWRHGIESSITDLVNGTPVMRRRRVSITFRKIAE